VRELPDGRMDALRAEEIDALLHAGARDAVHAQLAAWNTNLASRAFRVAVVRDRRSNARAQHTLRHCATSSAHVPFIPLNWGAEHARTCSNIRASRVRASLEQ
jgi:hypothetical protein